MTLLGFVMTLLNILSCWNFAEAFLGNRGTVLNHGDLYGAFKAEKWWILVKNCRSSAQNAPQKSQSRSVMLQNSSPGTKESLCKVATLNWVSQNGRGDSRNFQPFGSLGMRLLESTQKRRPWIRFQQSYCLNCNEQDTIAQLKIRA